MSHTQAGGPPPTESASSNLDMSGLLDGFIALLERWVEEGVAPPPTRSDAFDLGDQDRDGRNENAAIELPEIACPTGVLLRISRGR